MVIVFNINNVPKNKGVQKMGTKNNVVTTAQLVALVTGLCKRIAAAGYPATVSTNPTRVGIMVAGNKPQKLVLGINYPKTSGLIAISSPLFNAKNTATLVKALKGGFNPRGSNPYKGYAIASGRFTLAAINTATTTALSPLFKPTQ